MFTVYVGDFPENIPTCFITTSQRYFVVLRDFYRVVRDLISAAHHDAQTRRRVARSRNDFR